MKITEDHRKMLKIVSLYYEHELTQAAIAKKMGISRPIVSKMIQQAKEAGIVTISIKDETSYTVELALKIEKKYQLAEVIVVPANQYTAKEKIRRAISMTAATYLEKQLRPHLKIGLSWGTTLSDMIDVLPYSSFPTIDICPLVGGVSSEHLYFDTNHLVFRLAEKLNCRCQYFYAPALAEDLTLAELLNQSQLLTQIKQTGKNVDLAIIGVGNPNETSTWQKLNYWNNQDLEIIRETGVKGDAVASLFDKKGQTVNNSISQRMLGIKVEDLVHLPNVMIIAYGQEKIESIRPLLTGNCCSILIIDQIIAENLL